MTGAFFARNSWANRGDPNDTNCNKTNKKYCSIQDKWSQCVALEHVGSWVWILCNVAATRISSQMIAHYHVMFSTNGVYQCAVNTDSCTVACVCTCASFSCQDKETQQIQKVIQGFKRLPTRCLEEGLRPRGGWLWHCKEGGETQLEWRIRRFISRHT